MRILESTDNKEKFTNPVVTIGNYDGVHLGHRRIIEKVKEWARDVSGTSILMTFHPHPLHLLRPDKELAAITPIEEKKRIIAETGIDVLYILPFTKDFADISPESFVKSVLVDRLGVRGVVIGYDFTFGSKGRGNTTLLKEMGYKYGFFVEVIGAITLDGEKIGSNRIRKLVAQGEVGLAGKLLGRSYSIKGTVVRAKGRGRTIGYPTINLRTDYPLIPRNGVYVTEVEIEGRWLGGLTNVGYNPTFEQGQERSIETYILDFEGVLYDKEVTIRFVERIRDEMKFSGVEQLKAHIAKDVDVAREHFRRQGDRPA
ncbi:MAG: Riboflavin biosynthesis protein RibF [Syntrophorhabdaceae bacterium PtaU1.Bin034]|nr:MAG: Riboflavin biosynthesis protein RibF [Syntrophorhabdaceae bacterium PtaU1.Bin034]